ncbi:MAG: hypothetical protein LBH92_02030 [Bacteroidales bacterium]|jgi:hypothetical protein|nr:hypothetical protein [Bacteroidales bacterium]
MDSFFTILIYVGVFILIALAKSIGGAKKKNRAIPEKEYAEVDDTNYQKDYEMEQARNRHLSSQKISNAFFHFAPITPLETKEQKVPVDNVVEEELYEEQEASILDDFDLKSAVVYSEILNRPDY